jgi:hypothetical protein
LPDSDHPDTLACGVNLACDMFAVSDESSALDLSEDMLGRYQRVRGDDHPFTLACANNLAVFLRASGHNQRAKSIAEQTRSRCWRAIG